MAYHTRDTCRICGNGDLLEFLSLGPTPLANSFLRGPEQFPEEKSYPLDLYLCRTCSLVQLLDVVDPEVLFRDYIYVTGTSDTIRDHNVRYAATVVESLGLNGGSLVAEVASNDGSLLKCFQTHGVRTLGIEPATNIAAIARERGVETVNEFFGLQTATRLRETCGAADAIIGNNVLAHVDEVVGFLAGCRQMLKPEGRVIVEVPYLGELIERLEYDTVYHEHLSYFSVTALLRLCDEVGLSITKIERVPVHGGSIRMYAGRRDRFPKHDGTVIRMAEDEVRTGLTTPACFERFAGAVRTNRAAVRDLLLDIRDRGKSVAGYGAPAKGNTLLNFCSIDETLLPYTVDKNPMKVDLYTPGMHIPVLPVSALLERQPDFVFILAWNFAEEIMRQQSEYRDRGGRFIIPLPTPEVI